MLAVAGGKGGCGKTTTTLGLALAAAGCGRSVLAVDADVDVPDLHRVAGIDGPDDRRPGSLDPRPAAPNRDDPLREDSRRDAPSRDDQRRGRRPRPIPGAADVSVLPAGPGTDPGSLQERIENAAGSYDLVLLDCPAGGGRDAAIPLRAADRTVLVTTVETQSLRDAAKTGAMSRSVGAPVEGAVLTRAERVPTDVDILLGTTTVEVVPSATSPLRDATVIRRYRRILRRLPRV